MQIRFKGVLERGDVTVSPAIYGYDFYFGSTLRRSSQRNRHSNRKITPVDSALVITPISLSKSDNDRLGKHFGNVAYTLRFHSPGISVRAADLSLLSPRELPSDFQHPWLWTLTNDEISPWRRVETRSGRKYGEMILGGLYIGGPNSESIPDLTVLIWWFDNSFEEEATLRGKVSREFSDIREVHSEEEYLKAQSAAKPDLLVIVGKPRFSEEGYRRYEAAYKAGMRVVSLSFDDGMTAAEITAYLRKLIERELAR